MPQVIGLLTNDPTVTDQAKVMTILYYVVDVVSRQPYLSQSLLTMLQSQPELNSLFSTMFPSSASVHEQNRWTAIIYVSIKRYERTEEQIVHGTVLSNFWHSFCGKMGSIKLCLASALIKASLLLRCGDVEINPGPLTREGQTRLNEHNHSTLLKQLQIHSAKWREIGESLGFCPSELDEIQARPLLLSGATISFLSAMLADWLQWAPGDSRESTSFATLKDLKAAVRQAGLGATAYDLGIEEQQTPCPADESIEVISISSASETSNCSPRQLCNQEPEEPQYIYISSGEESVMEEANPIESDDKVTARVGGESGVPSEGADCVGGPTIHLTADSSVSKDEHNAIPTQQEGNGRSGGPSNPINMGCSTDHVKAIDDAPKLHQLEYLEHHSLTIKTINRVAAEWKRVALHLHFEGYHIKIIERDCPCQSNSACRTMFTQWLEGQGREPRTWRTLIVALGEADLHDIAEDLRNVLSDNFSAADSNQAIQDSSPAVVCRKRPLEKSTEEPAEKHPRLESDRASEPNSTNPHSADLATDEPLMKHRPKLAEFYSNQPEVPEGAWPPVKKTQYINLALIRTGQINFNKELSRQTIRGSIDDIMQDKDDIKYDEVFSKVDEGARLVFEGRPGCGKTTMMNKVSLDWGNLKIFSSCLLFLVHLRRLENRSDINLETVLRSTPVNFSDEEFQQIRTQIENDKGKGVVFALDGLDEYCPEKKKYKSTFIHKLICGEVLPKSIVIVASRPAASQKYRRKATRCIEVLGFLKDGIHEYIDSYFIGDEDKVLGLRTYLEHHPNVMHMCYLPLHMAMVTYLYEGEGASLPQTETEIYEHFTLSTLLRSIRKRDDMEVDDDEEFGLTSFDDLQQEDKLIFDLILELAYQSTVVNPKQVFSADEVRKFASRQSNITGSDRNSLGLVVVDKYFVRYGLKEIYTFLHLTFQEFLAACHVARLSFQDQKDIISKYGGDEKLGVVWKFYCGMTQFSDEQKIHNFEQLYEKSKDDVLLQLHCAHESQQDSLCTHIVKSYDSSIILDKQSLNPADFTALGYVLTHSNVPTSKLAITSCHIGPEGLSALVKAINSSSLAMRTLSFHKTKIKKMIPEFCDVLKKCPQLCTLTLSSSEIIKKVLSEMAEILPTLESLEQLDLSCNDLGKMCMEALGSVLIKLPNLKTLVWIKSLFTLSLIKTFNGRDIEIKLADSDNSKSSKQELVRFGDRSWGLDDVNLVSGYLQSHPCPAAFVQVLNFSIKGIDDAGAQSLAKGLLHCTNLQELHLDGNSIGDVGAQALAESLKGCTNLQKLSLHQNNIGDAGAQALAVGLQHCTKLQNLDLWGNNIGAQALTDCLTNLQEFYSGRKTIDLSGSNISDAGAQALAGILQHCTNLQNLNLRKNNIGDAGAQALAKGLQHCTNLQNLDLHQNNICDAGAQALAVGLQHCTKLQNLNLWGNNIGVQALADCLTNLQELYLGRKTIYLGSKNIGDADAQALARILQHCTNLQELRLGWNNIGDAGAQALAVGLQHCTNLQNLHLQGNNISDAGAQALAKGLQHSTKLQELKLWRNNIGDTGAHAVVEGLQHCTNLQMLYLQSNSLTDSSVGSLSRLIKTAKQLRTLDILDSKFTDDGRRALRAAAEERNSNPDFVNLSFNI